MNGECEPAAIGDSGDMSATVGTTNGAQSDGSSRWRASLRHKYVLLCLISGCLLVISGLIFIIIYAVLRNYTSSLHYFETVPTFVPSMMLVLNGIIVLSLSKRKWRYNYLIKISGVFCLFSALVCVITTVTTTVVHMNRLQALQECVYTPSSHTCLCVSGSGSAITATSVTELSVSSSSHYIFQDTPNCDVIHGTLYTCLRTLFGLSVFGIILCITSSMLVYQLLSHEKKRKYLEQLEIRRRFHANTAINCHSRGRHYDHLSPPSLPPQLAPFPFYPFPLMTPQLSPPPTADGYVWHTTATPPPWEPLVDYRPFYRSMDGDDSGAATQLISDSQERRWSILSLFTRRNRAESQHAQAVQPTMAATLVGRMPIYPLPPHVGRYRSVVPPPLRHLRARRPRTGDALFTHYNHFIHPILPIYGAPPPPPPTGHSPLFAAWGPPPPYTQQADSVRSANRTQQTTAGDVTTVDTTNRTIISSDNQSKMSTPMSERRLLCSTFTSNGITLTIGSGGGSGGGSSVGLNDSPTGKKNSCIVEVHVGDVSRVVNGQPIDINSRSSEPKKPPLTDDYDDFRYGDFEKIRREQSTLTFLARPTVDFLTTKIDLIDEKSASPSARSQLISTGSQLISSSGESGIRECFYSTSDDDGEIVIAGESSVGCNQGDSNPIGSVGAGGSSGLCLIDEKTSSDSVESEKSPLELGSLHQLVNDDLSSMSKIIYAQSMPNLSFEQNLKSRSSVGFERHKSPSVDSSPDHFRPISDRLSSSGNTSTSADFGDSELEIDDAPIGFTADCECSDGAEQFTTIGETTLVEPVKQDESTSGEQRPKSADNTSFPLVKPPSPYNNSNSNSNSDQLVQRDNIVVTIKSIHV